MKIGIIGGTRGLGKTLAWFFKEDGFDVTITGRDSVVGELVSNDLGVAYSSDNVKVVESSDIVIISVPIASTLDVIGELAPHMSEGSLLIDVTSVKENPSKVMAEFTPKGVDFIPMHPVFGPRTTDLDGQVIVLTPIVKGFWYDRVKNYLISKKMRVIETSPEEHDKMMAIVQVLTHFAYISTAYTIAKLNVNIKDTQDFESPIYNLMLDTIARIVSQNPFLTYSIQYENNQGNVVRDTFAEAVCELKDAIFNGDEKGFVDMAVMATKNMGDIQSALGRSDKAVNSLNHENRLLKKSLGKFIGLRHIYSGKIHVGILEELGSEFLILKTTKHCHKLKIANIEVLSDAELFKWRVDNQTIINRFISCIFPVNSDCEVICSILGSVDDVVDVSVSDVYEGPQIKKGFISFTFEINALSEDVFDNIISILKGFGGLIR